MDIAQFVYLFTLELHLGCFQVMTVMKCKTTVNIQAHVFLWAHAFISLGEILRNVIPGSYDKYIF